MAMAHFEIRLHDDVVGDGHASGSDALNHRVQGRAQGVLVALHHLEGEVVVIDLGQRVLLGHLGFTCLPIQVRKHLN